ncbi:hypothetical protein Q5752_000965 [Cryptotrichosporon argae]
MSRPRHRKSTSTSALAVLAADARPAAPALGAVAELGGCAPGGTGDEEDDGATETGAERAQNKGKGKEGAGGTDDARRYFDDIRSLRSSGRRRTAAARGLERCLLAACDGHVIGRFLALKLHQPLLALLARHTSTLTRRSSSSLPPGDEVAGALGREIEPAVSVLQGLCLLSRECKDAVGERWVLEMIIDLLLLLRAQPGHDGRKPVAYALLELAFCVLVDRPDHARRYEQLGGLEAATRVLKGTGVAKEVRMKCIEFLYFYLLPENTGRRSTSATSASSSSSGSSALYPPSPLDTTAIPPSPVPTPVAPVPTSPTKHWDLDVPFVPQTPRKPAKPELGFPTPSARRVSAASSAASASASSSPVLGTPGRVAAQSQPDFRRATRDSRDVGLGLGRLAEHAADETAYEDGVREQSMVEPRMPRSRSSASFRSTSAAFGDPFARPASRAESHGSSNSSLTVVPRRPSPMARVGSSGSSGSESARTDVSAARRTSSVAPGVPRLPRSSTQPALAPVPRVPSAARARSPLVQSSVPDAPARAPSRALAQSSTRPDLTDPTRPAQPDPSADDASLPAHATPVSAPTPRRPRAFPPGLTRGLPAAASVPNLAALPLGPARRVSGRQVSGGPPGRVDEHRKDGEHRTDGENRSEAPAAAKRTGRDVRSVDEKKEMLGRWLGNVDQLVQGVERVGIWANVK